MQTLYTMESLEGMSKPGETQKVLQQHFSQTKSLLVYLNWFLTQVARYAETEAHKRASKHLPSAEDLNVNTIKERMRMRTIDNLERIIVENAGGCGTARTV